MIDGNTMNDLKNKINKVNNMEIYINVLIRDKKFRQYCGVGQQKLRWLTDCAIFKYENANDHKIQCGVAYGLKTETGELCDLNNTIASTLQNGANVMVLLKEEYEVEIEERKKRKLNGENNKESLNNNNVYLERLNELEENSNEHFNNFGDDNENDDEFDSNNNDNEEDDNNLNMNQGEEGEEENKENEYNNSDYEEEENNNDENKENN